VPVPTPWRSLITSKKAMFCLVAMAAVLSGCGDQPEAPSDRPRPDAAQGRGPSPALSPVAEGVEAATATVACVDGWTIPEDPEQRELPFHVIRRSMQVDGDFHVVEERYFEGPEGPPTDKPYLSRVDRWYVKAWLEDDPSFRGRWLIEERSFGSGVAAVAPFDSEGFRSPDWLAFQYEGEEVERRAYPGLPGTWAGTAYDFVTGRDPESGEPAFRFPGLPPEVAGCLIDT
jgi:hypothetical protein